MDTPTEARRHGAPPRAPDDDAPSRPATGPGGANAAADDEVLREAIELLFFAYRDFTSEPDAILARYGFGRAHHRVIYFIGRHPGLTVSDLLGILRITKQSLARVLRQLLAEGFVRQEVDAGDRRRRPLRLTPRGESLERRLSEQQRRRIARAYRDAGPEAVAGFRQVMRRVTDERDRFPL